MKFEYISSTSREATGSVTLAFDYDPADRPGTEVYIDQARNFQDCATGHVSSNLSLRLQAEDLRRRGSLYVKRTMAIVPNQDTRATDLGRLFVFSEMPDRTIDVRIFCDYEIELFVPQASLRQTIVNIALETAGSPAPAPAVPFGSGGTGPIGTGGKLVGATDNIIVTDDGIQFVKGGTYQVRGHVYGSQVDGTSMPTYTATNLAGVPTPADLTVNVGQNRINNPALNETDWMAWFTTTRENVKVLFSYVPMVTNIVHSAVSVFEWTDGLEKVPLNLTYTYVADADRTGSYRAVLTSSLAVEDDEQKEGDEEVAKIAKLLLQLEHYKSAQSNAYVSVPASSSGSGTYFCA
jgi:hypothetical protein